VDYLLKTKHFMDCLAIIVLYQYLSLLDIWMNLKDLKYVEKKEYRDLTIMGTEIENQFYGISEVSYSSFSETSDLAILKIDIKYGQLNKNKIRSIPLDHIDEEYFKEQKVYKWGFKTQFTASKILSFNTKLTINGCVY